MLYRQALSLPRCKARYIDLSLLKYLSSCLTILGCNLSPLLFSLFIANLGSVINSSGLGFDLGTVNISAILFADDLCVIGRSRKALDELMLKVRRFFHDHHLHISESKSKVISYEASTETTSFQGSSLFPPLSLDQVLSYKYLGVPLNCSPYCLFKSFNDQVKKRAQMFMGRVLSLVKSGPNRSDLAYSLWTNIALPSILYGCEVIPLNDGTIKEIEKCQSAVGRFILQVPSSSSNVCVHIDSGLKPIWSIVAEKVLLYAQSTMTKEHSFWPKLAMDENIGLGFKSAYTRYLLRWKTDLQCFDLNSNQIRKTVRNAAINDIINQQRITSTTSFAMNRPGSSKSCQWFRPKPWVSDSPLSQIFAHFRTCNIGLGNRRPAKNGLFYKFCPLCEKTGLKALNTEVALN